MRRFDVTVRARYEADEDANLIVPVAPEPDYVLTQQECVEWHVLCGPPPILPDEDGNEAARLMACEIVPSIQQEETGTRELAGGLTTLIGAARWYSRLRDYEVAGQEPPGDIEKAKARYERALLAAAASLPSGDGQRKALAELVKWADEAQGHHGIEECAAPGQPATEWDEIQRGLRDAAEAARPYLTAASASPSGETGEQFASLDGEPKPTRCTCECEEEEHGRHIPPCPLALGNYNPAVAGELVRHDRPEACQPATPPAEETGGSAHGWPGDPDDPFMTRGAPSAGETGAGTRYEVCIGSAIADLIVGMPGLTMIEFRPDHRMAVLVFTTADGCEPVGDEGRRDHLGFVVAEVERVTGRPVGSARLLPVSGETGDGQ